MTARRAVQSELAERAIAAIRFACADFQVESQQSVDDVGRLLDGRNGATQRRQEERLSYFLSIAETFCSDRFLAAWSEKRGAAPAPSTINWKQRIDAWNGLGVRLDDAGWQSLSTFVEIRNAIMHGQGELTAFQLSQDRVRDSVFRGRESFGLHTDGKRILLDTDDVRNSADQCIHFISELDALARA